jgi:hypothetical protein
MTLHQDLFSNVGRVGIGLVHRVRAVVSGIAFWTGIAIPLAYPLFIVSGTLLKGQIALVLGLIAIDYLALILGYSHHNPSNS